MIISDEYSSDSRPQPELTPLRPERNKARTVCIEQVPTPPPKETGEFYRLLSAQNVIIEGAGPTPPARN